MPFDRLASAPIDFARPAVHSRAGMASPFDAFQAELARVHAETARTGMHQALESSYDSASIIGCNPLSIVPALIRGYAENVAGKFRKERVDAVANLALGKLRSYSRPRDHVDRVSFDVVVIGAFEAAILGVGIGAPYPTGISKGVSLGFKSLFEWRNPVYALLEDMDEYYGRRICNHFRSVVGGLLVCVNTEGLASESQVTRLLVAYQVESSKDVGSITSPTASHRLAGATVRRLLAPERIEGTRRYLSKRYGSALAEAEVFTDPKIESFQSEEKNPGGYIASRLPHEELQTGGSAADAEKVAVR